MKQRGLVGLILVLAVFLAVGITQAATWNVPGFFATIQLANDSALVNNGDTILVSEGYFEFPTTSLTKSLTVRGSGIGRTILTTYWPVFWISTRLMSG